MGRRPKIYLAYIAGFLDGDGSLMFQIKKRKDGNKSRHRFMLTICFYQDSRYEKPLFWIRDVLEIGYISRRTDGITELRINGYKQIESILEDLLPFLKFKRRQAEMILESAKLLQKREFTDTILRRLVDYIVQIQKENYTTRKKRNKKQLLKILGLSP